MFILPKNVIFDASEKFIVLPENRGVTKKSHEETPIELYLTFKVLIKELELQKPEVSNSAQSKMLTS